MARLSTGHACAKATPSLTFHILVTSGLARPNKRRSHAKGAGGFGRFEVTEEVSAYTRAAVFQPGTSTRMLAPFSTVAGALDGVRSDVLERALTYWRNVDDAVGQRIADAVNAKT